MSHILVDRIQVSIISKNRHNARYISCSLPMRETLDASHLFAAATVFVTKMTQNPSHILGRYVNDSPFHEVKCVLDIIGKPGLCRNNNKRKREKLKLGYHH